MPLDGHFPQPLRRASDVSNLAAFLARYHVECIECGHTDRSMRFITHSTDRGGVEIEHCKCPSCSTKWRRIVHPG
jgi:hypothetical protein